MNRNPTSADGPTSRALTTVPTPGLWRMGIHSSKTTALTIVVTTPNESGACRVMPCVSTSHGAAPRALRTRKAMPTPYRKTPTSSWAMRRGILLS
jgi:hypothetical protein